MALLVLGAGCRWLGVPALPALGVSCLLISQIAFTSRTKKQHKQPQIASRKSAPPSCLTQTAYGYVYVCSNLHLVTTCI